MQMQMQSQSLPQPKRRKTYNPQRRVLPFDRKDYFNSREIGELFGVSYVSIHRYSHAGDFLQPVKVSQRKHYWNKHDVFEWVANNQDSFLLRNLDL